MSTFNPDNYCFVCGKENPVGLKLTFTFNAETNETVSHVVFPQHFQGWTGIVHGGLISTVLDEIMFHAAFHRVPQKMATVEMTVRFKKPARIDKTFTLTGKVIDIKRRLICAEGHLIDSDHVLVASASGKFMVVD
ncbi:MAG: PaaI family thioesterase [Candidatus Omnitrophota bacterium]